ncbi:MAG: pantoate kinase [Methanosarcinales archaeon]|nr:pantoate kinase [Methanosarcinales archaeon]
MIAGAFAPAHITGFFSVIPNTDPLKAGSLGCGLCLEAGVRAKIDTHSAVPAITFNGEHTDFPTVEYVLNELLGTDRPPFSLDLTSDVRPGFGFGVSGAAALAAGFACAQVYDARTGERKIAAVAHCAEVLNRTGMGDVAGQCTGGLVMRTAPGAPGVGVTRQISVKPCEISWVCLGEISTASILGEEETMKRVNEMGVKALKSLRERPGLEHFMSLSRQFAVEAGLISSRALDAVEAVESQGGMASMAMLGDTVFAPGKGEALQEFGNVGHSRFGFIGARTL